MDNISIVIDANILLRPEGIDLSRSYLTTPSVRDEVKSQGGRINMTAISLVTKEPSEKSVETVREKSKELNSRVSEQDIELAGLAMETDSKILTDDMDLQNLCFHLNIEFEGVLNEIDEPRKWELVCPRCGSHWEGQNCSSCGYGGDPDRKPID